MTTVQRRIKTPWPPELEAIVAKDTIEGMGGPASPFTYAQAKKNGVYWVDGVIVRLVKGQQILCQRDVYVAYKGGDGKPWGGL